MAQTLPRGLNPTLSPALDRTRAISAFSFDEFAIVKAAPQQSELSSSATFWHSTDQHLSNTVKDNKAKQATIQRRPSRVLAPPKRNVANALAPPPLPAQPSAALTASSMMLGVQSIAAANSSFRPGTMGVSSALAVPVLLKVRLPPLPGVEAINTTINVPNDMYMSDVLDHICKKRGIDNPKDWALVVEHDGEEIVVPLDRTVNSLGDRHQLNLVKRSQIASLRGQPRQTNVRTNVNPSGAPAFADLLNLQLTPCAQPRSLSGCRNRLSQSTSQPPTSPRRTNGTRSSASSRCHSGGTRAPSP